MFKKRLSLAYKEIIDGLTSWKTWVALGYADIQIQYRRSTIGPFWITLSMGVMIYSMGFLYGSLFKMDMYSYFPHLAVGFLVWNFISAMVVESTNSFIEASGFIKQEKRPFPIYVFRVIVRNVIIAAHNFIAIVPILIFTTKHFGITQFVMLIFGFILLMWCCITFGMILGVLGARFRDLHQIVNSCITLIFFVTPIVWTAEMLPPNRAWISQFNPISHMINLIREPLIGKITSSSSLIMSLLICIISSILAMLCFARTRHRIAFWV
ncbi:MAG: ABC transporter permease [Legionellales bacterium]|nr:ABC transporter permease [Legionellales bacterium]